MRYGRAGRMKWILRRAYRHSGWLVGGMVLCLAAFGPPVFGQQAPEPPFLRIEMGTHTDAVQDIDADARGRLVVTGSWDHTARVWEAATGKPYRVLRVPLVGAQRTSVGGMADVVAISPDGRTAVCGGQTTASMHVFDVGSGRMTRRIDRPADYGLLDLEFSRDGRYLAVAQALGLNVYETTGYSVVHHESLATKVSGVSFGPKGDLAVACMDGSVRLYTADFRLLTAKPVVPVTAETVVRVSYSPDGTRLAACWRFTCKEPYVVSAKDLSPLRATGGPVPGHLILRVGWSPDGQTLYGGVTDTGVYRWGNAGEGPGEPFARLSSGAAMVVLPGGEVACASRDAVACFAADGQRVWLVQAPKALHRVWWTGESDVGLSASSDGTRVQYPVDSQGRSFAGFALGKGFVTPAPAPRDAGLEGPVDKRDGVEVTNYSKGPGAARLNGQPLEVFANRWVHSADITPGGYGILITQPPEPETLRMLDRAGAQRWATVTPSIPMQAKAASGGKVAVATFTDGTLGWFSLADGRPLLTLFPHTDGKRWVLWTPSGYYDCSPGGEELIGWQMGNGPDQSPDFFPASRFRSTYYRPDVVGKILQTLDEAEALRQANAESGRTQMAASITQVLPPVVTLLSPTDGTEVGTPNLTLRYLVRTPADAPVTAVKVLVDGRPGETQRAVVVRPTGEAREIPVTIPARDCEIALIAENRNAASVPATVRIHWKGAAPQAPPDRPKLYLVAVGISAYQDSDLRLQFAAKDATDFAGIMRRNARLYGGVEARVLTDGKATRSEVIRALEWVQALATRNDVAMVFLSGHGVNDEQGRYFFVPADFDRERIAPTGVPTEEIRRVVAETPGKVLFFLDSCHSGNALGAGARRRADATGFVNTLASVENGAVVFTASTGSQVAFENPAWGNGAFTRALVEGLAGKADPFKKGEVTVSGLELYIDMRVRELTEGKQTPATAKPQTVTNFTVAMPGDALPAAPEAPADAGWSLKPGETGLSGKVLALDGAAGTFTLEADTYVGADGKPVPIQPARRKTVRLTPETAGKGLADLKLGDSVRVTGKDAGPGKPLAATEVR